MSQVMVLCCPAVKVECGNCDWTGSGSDLEMICDFEDRVMAGDVTPAGECPECCALAYVAGDKA